MRDLDAATRRVVVGHALAAVGMSAPWPLLAVLVWDATRDDLLLGMTGAARLLPYVLLSWAAGRLADRWARDRIVMLSLWLRVATLTAAALAVQVGAVGAAVVLCALAIAVATPAYPALAASLPGLAGVHSVRATELLVTVEVASFVVGPALGGLVLGLGAGSVLPALSVAMLLAAVRTMAPVRLPRPVPGPVHGVIGTAGAPGATGGVGSLVRSSRRVRSSLLVFCVVNLLLAVLGVALLPLAEALWAGGDRDYGLAVGVLGFGALAAPLLDVLGLTPAARVRLGMVVFGAATLLVLPSPEVAWSLLPLGLVGAVAVHVESAATSVLQEEVPDRLRASVLGLGDTAMISAALVGSLAAPWLVGRLGGGGMLALVAGCAVLLGVTSRDRSTGTVPVPVPSSPTPGPRPAPTRSPAGGGAHRGPRRRPRRTPALARR